MDEGVSTIAGPSRSVAALAQSTVVPVRDGQHDARRQTAQVSPLPAPAVPLLSPVAASSSLVPRVDDFHVGKILADPATVIRASREHEESYIPVALAKAHLAKVVADMHAMKDEQTSKMNQILDRYKVIESETKAHYDDRISELKTKAKGKWQAQEEKYFALQRDTQAKETQTQQAIAELHESSRVALLAHGDEKKRWKEELESVQVAHEEQITRLHQRIQRELELAVHRREESLAQLHRSALDKVAMYWEDTHATFTRAINKLQRDERHWNHAERAFRAQIRDLEHANEIERETYKCLATIVNRVVDMEQHVGRRKRSRELRGEIERLSRQMNVSIQREGRLASELAQVVGRYEEMERLAVRQTMSFMLRNVELAVDSCGEAQVSSQPEPDLRRMKAAATVDGEAQTVEELTRVQPIVTATTSDACVETEPVDAAAPLTRNDTVSVPTDSVRSSQLQYEADAERFLVSNTELLRSKQELRAVKAHTQQCLERKNAAKARIKEWLAEFQAVNARDPTIDEKAQVKEMYLEFKESEESYNAAKEHTAQRKAQHHEKVVEIEALSQWHALAASVRISENRKEGKDESEHQRGDDSGVLTVRSTASSRPASRQLTSRASTARVLALEKEINDLRDELVRNRQEAKAADAALEIAQAQAQARHHEDAVADAMAESHDTDVAEEDKLRTTTPGGSSDVEDAPVEAKPSRISGVGDELREQKLRDQLGAFVREAKVMEAEREELADSITQLRNEIATRRAEKTQLEKQIEQLRLHLELTDAERGGALEDLMEMDSDAKSVRRKTVTHEEFRYNDVDADGSGEDSGHADTHIEDEDDGDVDTDAEADIKAPSSMMETMTMVSPSLTDAEKADGAKEAQLVLVVKDAIEAGKAQWNRGDKAKCYQLYVKASERAVETLRELRVPRKDDVAAFKAALAEAGRLPPAKGSMVLRRQLDALLAGSETRVQERENKALAAATSAAAAATEAAVAASSPNSCSPAPRKPHKKSVAPSSADDKASDGSAPFTGTASAGVTASGGNRALEEYKLKLKVLEGKAKADRVKITQLEAALSKAETQLTTAVASGSGGGSGAATVVLERKLADAEKKHAKALEDAEKSVKRDIAALSQQLQGSQSRSQALQEQVDKMTKELATLGGRASQLSKVEEEAVVLRDKAAQVDVLTNELSTSRSELAKLEVSYREEQSLRKKYYNQIEDMKGKIRVFARCRPMSSSERERGCDQCVRFVDEYSLELKTSHGPKMFAYDQVFTPASSQEQVFEDTKNLVQSALDGYNVCIFAYGQTGSGKTFTMTGSDALPGISPRVIHQLFRVADEAKANHTVTFQAFMLELYNDALIDLFYLVDGGHEKDAPKLDIKKNDRGMVFVQNITIKACASAAQTLKSFELANKKRQVGATRMNAESSRSHSVFSILVENYNKTTKTTTVGKLSLVDLAGSERAGKTGATAERLKEAQAINKSLSALGDVISALSTNEKFIPYRNNKLTQLMQDSLGGNAKTLMFVNISPADYNQEETQTSLQYASRVKLITNNANKNAESETVNRLKNIIKQLRAGKTDVDLEGVLE